MNITFENTIFWDNEAGSGPVFYANVKQTLNFVFVNWPGNIADCVPAVPDLDTSPINTDPLFAPVVDFSYLSQIAAGQAVDSPDLDTGDENAVGSNIEGMTTRSDLVWDTGVSDRGFHYPNGRAPMQPACINHVCQLNFGPGPNMDYPEVSGQISGHNQGGNSPEAKNSSRKGVS